MRHAQDNPVIALFGLYYLLVDTGALWARVKRHFPISDHLAEQLADRFVRVTDALVLESGVTAIVQGVVVGVGFEIVGLRPAILWGFVTACASVLPLFGSALVWLPGTIVLLIDQRPGAALFLLSCFFELLQVYEEASVGGPHAGALTHVIPGIEAKAAVRAHRLTSRCASIGS
jgi:predicted PurR-regulated permease PerM